jgi:Na+/H+-dicarboxylate symporter
MALNLNFKKLGSDLGVQIIIAMILGVITGRLMGESAVMFAPLGTLFIQLIKMLVVPLVFVSIVSGAASLGATNSAGRIGITAILYIFSTTIVAVFIAFFVGSWLQPGAGIPIELIRSFVPTESYLLQADKMEFWPMLLSIIPANPIESMAEGNILHLIFFGLFLGFGLSALPASRKDSVVNGFNVLLEALIWCIGKVMWVAPIGVFGLMADATGTFGYDLLFNVANLFWANILAALFLFAGLYPLTLRLFSKTKVTHFYKEMLRPQLVALSTSSSLATLPVTLKTCEEKLGVSKETSSFVVPLGATINMTGSAIYYTLVALFFAQLYGIELTMAQYVAITVTATIGSIGQAGVPGPTLLVVAVLVSAGIPVEGLPLLYALDRVFDMLRTVLNITGDAACSVVVDHVSKSRK